MVTIYELAVLHGAGRKEHGRMIRRKGEGDEMDKQHAERLKNEQKWHERDMKRKAEQEAERQKYVRTERQNLEAGLRAMELAAEDAQRRSAVEIEDARIAGRGMILDRRLKMCRTLFADYEATEDALHAGSVTAAQFALT